MADDVRLAQYNPSRVVASWGVPGLPFGSIPLLEGAASGTFVNLERTSRTWSLKVGGDGETTRTRTNDFSGIVRFTLRNGSRTSNLLTAALQSDEITGVVVGAFLMTDYSGTTLWASPLAFLEGWPPESFGDTEENRTWTLICSPLIPLPGGSRSL